MKLSLVAIIAMSLLALGCAEEFKPTKTKEEAKPTMTTPAAKPVPAPTTAKPVLKPTKKPDPTDPKEIEEARKLAILDGRTDDAVRLCGKEDLSKVGEQGALGCVLAACREKNTEKAQEWVKRLGKALKKEAIKVCTAGGVGL